MLFRTSDQAKVSESFQQPGLEMAHDLEELDLTMLL